MLRNYLNFLRELDFTPKFPEDRISRAPSLVESPGEAGGGWGWFDALLSQEPPSPILPTTTPTQPNPTLKIWQVHLYNIRNTVSIKREIQMNRIRGMVWRTTLGDGPERILPFPFLLPHHRCVLTGFLFCFLCKQVYCDKEKLRGGLIGNNTRLERSGSIPSIIAPEHSQVFSQAKDQ